MARDREGRDSERDEAVFPPLFFLLVRHPTRTSGQSWRRWLSAKEKKKNEVSSAFFPAVCSLAFSPPFKANL